MHLNRLKLAIKYRQKKVLWQLSVSVFHAQTSHCAASEENK
jgi:hypothetical protein